MTYIDIGLAVVPNVFASCCDSRCRPDITLYEMFEVLEDVGVLDYIWLVKKYTKFAVSWSQDL